MASFRNQVGNLCAALFLLSICCIRSLIFTLGNGLPEKASAEILLLLVIIFPLLTPCIDPDVLNVTPVLVDI